MPNLKRQSGLAIAGILLLVSFVVLGGIVTMNHWEISSLQNHVRAFKKLRTTRSPLVRVWLRSGLDCDATLALAPTCDGVTPIDLVRFDTDSSEGAIMVKTDGSVVFRGTEVKANCNVNGGKTVIRINRYEAGSLTGVVENAASC